MTYHFRNAIFVVVVALAAVAALFGMVLVGGRLA